MTLRNHLTEFEKFLLRSQDLVEIRGKTGRGVPLLIPNEVKKVLEFISNDDVRKNAGIKVENVYMFANTGNSVQRAGDSLDTVKGRPDVQLKHPNRIFANNLRKQTATIVQALNLDDNEVKWVCNHLGHTQRVHDQYYRQTSGLIERIDIAKLMLMQERNLVSKFSNMKLSEIQFEDLEMASDDQVEAQEAKQDDNSSEYLLDDDVGDLLDDGEDEKKRKRNAATRKRWSDEETKELRTYFCGYFDGKSKRTCPKQSECVEAIRLSKESKGSLWKRHWETIKKKLTSLKNVNKKF